MKKEIEKTSFFSRDNLSKKIIILIPALIIFVIIFAFFSQFQFSARNPYFSGEDAFYHVGMAKYIMAHGIAQKFPYLYFTVLNEQFVDHHFLFHLFLIPFISAFGDVPGAKLYIISVVAANFALLYLIFRELKLKFALIYPIILFFLMPSDFYFRMSFIRAESTSLFFMLLLYFLIIKGKPWAVGILAFLYVWLYNAFPFIFVLLFAYFIVQLFSGKKVDYKILLFGILGTAAGLVINPYFPKNIGFFFVQTFETGLGAKPYVGGEWRPYDTWFWFSISMVPIIFFFGGIAISFLKNLKQNSKTLILFVLSLFLIFLQWKSKRFVEYWPFFGAVTGLAFCGNYLEEKMLKFKDNLKELEGWFIAIVLIVLIPISLSYGKTQFNRGLKDSSTTWQVDSARQAHNYLKSHSDDGDIVFTDDWDVFPVYFYLNQKNYYIVGLDPEYMNQYDSRLYQEYADISSGRDSFRLDHIKKDFKSTWVLVANDHQKFKNNLEQQPDLFEKVFDNGNYYLFKVL